MSALAYMRLAAFLRGGRALVPLLTAVVIVCVWYGGGQAEVSEAYGGSAVVLFPVMAWQTKMLLDVEPDVQRRLARVALGRRREIAADIAAATVAALTVLLLALVVPWLVNGVRLPRAGEVSLGGQVGLGLWGLLLAVPAAVALGALASRSVTRGALWGVAVLVTGSVLVIVLGLQHSFAPWAVPPVMATARTLNSHPTAAGLLLPTLQAALWTAMAVTAYAVLRRRRS